MPEKTSDEVNRAPETPVPACRAEASPKTTRKKKSLPRRLLRWAAFVLYVLILSEVASRAYWSIKHRDRGMPFFPAWSDWVDRFYEEIRDSGVRDARPQPEDGFFDVLLLGGSAQDRVYDSLADASGGKTVLQDRLGEIVSRPVRVFNLAHPGMTTRDSLLKYQMLTAEGLHFDLVVVYHGVNDVRMNNIAAEKFRDDYTHSGFYRQFRRLRDYQPMLPYFTLPYTIEYTAVHVLSSKKLGVYLPKHRPSEEQLSHGVEIKTDRTFRRNVEGILDLAKDRGEPVLLLTFAWYIPENYTKDKCKAGQLDYARSPRPSLVEMWGSTDGVPKGIRAHNDVLRQLALEHPEAMFVDADLLIPKRGENFNDVCHLSEAGKVGLLDAFLPALQTGLHRLSDDAKE
ncbi:MAG: hypothetical protein JW849_11180 [Phycisphaerae bacterium]|nr:hypothetical protein [Phycisphaerae bacterium]